MRKIIGILRPFDIYQTFYVYEDGNKIEIVNTKIKDIPTTVLELSNHYNVNQIDFSGAKHFSEGIVKKIQEEEMSKYNKNNLTFNYI